MEDVKGNQGGGEQMSANTKENCHRKWEEMKDDESGRKDVMEKRKLMYRRKGIKQNGKEGRLNTRKSKKKTRDESTKITNEWKRNVRIRKEEEREKKNMNKTGLQRRF